MLWLEEPELRWLWRVALCDSGWRHRWLYYIVLLAAEVCAWGGGECNDCAVDSSYVQVFVCVCLGVCVVYAVFMYMSVCIHVHTAFVLYLHIMVGVREGYTVTVSRSLVCVVICCCVFLCVGEFFYLCLCICTSPSIFIFVCLYFWVCVFIGKYTVYVSNHISVCMLYGPICTFVWFSVCAYVCFYVYICESERICWHLIRHNTL